MTSRKRNFYAFQWHAGFHTLTIALTEIVGATSLTTAIFPLVAGGLILAVGYTPVFLAVSAIVASAFAVTAGFPLSRE